MRCPPAPLCCRELPARLTGLGLLVVLGLGLLTQGSGCVVSYGSGPALRPAEPLPPPGDFAEVEVRLELLLDGETEVDRRDRFDAALDLLRAGRTMDIAPQARVLRYLQRLVTIEERSQPVDAPTLFSETLPETTATFDPLTGGIVEEDLGGLQQLDLVEEPPAVQDPAVQDPAVQDPAVQDPAVQDPAVQDPAAEEPAASLQADPVSVARSALEAGDPAGALAALALCDLVDCADGVQQLTSDAREAWIHTERERAGALFVRARSEPDLTDRKARLVEARQILLALLDRFPDAPDVEDIKRNVDLVDKALASLH